MNLVNRLNVNGSGFPTNITWHVTSEAADTGSNRNIEEARTAYLLAGRIVAVHGEPWVIRYRLRLLGGKTRGNTSSMIECKRDCLSDYSENRNGNQNRTNAKGDGFDR